ncbi:MAG: 16S rRNA (adenine(1518)-N(6)/adenine(1519)-N(6)) -dimethyltransferase RsmA [Gammaproteobacteria bacterium]
MIHRPRKRFGQNFLHDPGVIQRIVAAIDPQPDEHLVEIGPGRGAITRPLLEKRALLDVIELDRDLIEPLHALEVQGARPRVHNADALRFDFRALSSGERLRIVGNLPYNISTPLIFHLLEQIDVIRDMHFMLQREVVKRIAAQPGTSDWGRLGIMVQYYCRVTPLFGVAPGAFHPAPRVHSSVVRLIPHATPPVPLDDPARLARITAQAFSRRRKTLRNALRGLVDEQTLQALGIDPQRRPETLTLTEFAALANSIPREG